MIRGKTFGERLRGARQARGMTQKQLADVVGVRQPAIASMEVGSIMEPRASLAWRLERALDLQPYDLIRPYGGR